VIGMKYSLKWFGSSEFVVIRVHEFAY